MIPEDNPKHYKEIIALDTYNSSWLPILLFYCELCKEQKCKEKKKGGFLTWSFLQFKDLTAIYSMKTKS